MIVGEKMKCGFFYRVRKHRNSLLPLGITHIVLQRILFVSYCELSDRIVAELYINTRVLNREHLQHPIRHDRVSLQFFYYSSTFT